MKLVSVATILAVCVSLTTGATCPERDIDYGGNDIKGIPNVNSWEDCSRQCQTSSACYGWTWVTPTFANVVARKYCYVKKSNFRNGRAALAGVISGEKACGEPAPYAKINIGSCKSISKAMCKEIAKKETAKKEHFQFIETSGSDAPPGCYYLKGYDSIYFNTATSKSSCTSLRNCLCQTETPTTTASPNTPTVSSSTTTRPLPSKTWRDFPYDNYKDKKCSSATVWEHRGCHDTKSYSARKQLLVYWRYDIEWAPNRIPSFASSFICACAEAAKAGGVTHFGTHFWGECFALDMLQVTDAANGDCILADGTYKNKCTLAQSYDYGCLGSKSYYVYSV